jgi:hypothetical protein
MNYYMLIFIILGRQGGEGIRTVKNVEAKITLKPGLSKGNNGINAKIVAVSLCRPNRTGKAKTIN